MLSTIQQRYPSILQSVAEEIIFGKEDAKEAVEQLIISLSLVSVSISLSE
jgi:U3 small nucleolar RNA-associated protein 10